MLTRAGLLAALVALLLPAGAHAAGQVARSGASVTYTDTSGAADAVQVRPTPSGGVRFVRVGGQALTAVAPCTGDDAQVTCAAPVSAITLNLGAGGDAATIADDLPAGITVTLDGGDGDDELHGGPGPDTFRGGPGADAILSRDGRGEPVDCGAGDDGAGTDPEDAQTGCERASTTPGLAADRDLDGVRPPVDCDDTNAAIRPGAPEVLDDKIDQDCDGADAVDLDRDKDGSERPLDCDDATPAIRPGLREVRGNPTDENCDGEILPFPLLTGGLKARWERSGFRMRNTVLEVRDFPKGTAVELACFGRKCPLKVKKTRVTSAKKPVRLGRFLKRRALLPNVKIQVTLTLKNRVGRIIRYKVLARGELPEIDQICVSPGRGRRHCSAPELLERRRRPGPDLRIRVCEGAP